MLTGRRVDLCHSIMWEIMPRFELVDFIGYPIGYPCAEPGVTKSKLSLRSMASTTSLEPYVEITIHILTEMHALGRMLRTTDIYGAVVLNSTTYSDRVETLERWTVKLLQVDKCSFSNCVRTDLTSQSDSIKAFAYAAIIHIYWILHDLPRNLRIFGVVANRLHALLANAAWTDELPDLYIWTLLMGTAAAASVEVKAWYVSMLQTSCYHRGIVDQHSLRDALQQFFWSDTYLHVTRILRMSRVEGVDTGVNSTDPAD